MAARSQDNLPLRERKKAITRQALIDAAQRLFAERGFDAVTVAEIADAANVSVKTLFVYFRSKEDLAFAGQGLIDAFVAALAARPAGIPAAAVIAQVLIDAIDPEDVHGGLEGFHRGYGRSTALESGLLRMWAGYEDRITAELAREEGAAPAPVHRSHAMHLVAMARVMTAEETRAAVAPLSGPSAAAELKSMLLVEADAVARAYPS